MKRGRGNGGLGEEAGREGILGELEQRIRWRREQAQEDGDKAGKTGKVV
jgi:hypothetical protein